jgi:hypothetical protein
MRISNRVNFYSFFYIDFLERSPISSSAPTRGFLLVVF